MTVGSVVRQREDGMTGQALPRPIVSAGSLTVAR